MKKYCFLFAFFTIFLITVSEGHWVDEQAKFLEEEGILQKVFDQYNSNEILDRAITREEFFSLVAVTNGNIGSMPNGTFEDFNLVNPKYQLYIGELTNEGIIAGSLNNGKLYIKPKTEITRQEAAVILSKMFNLDNENYAIKFNDNSAIHDWAKKYITGVVKVKIMNGYPDNTIKPLKNITIAEAIAIVTNSYSLGYFSTGKVENYAGNGQNILVNGEKLNSTFNNPYGLAIKDNKIYIADSGNNAIRVIENNLVSSIAGSDIGRNEYNEVIGSFRDGENALFDKPTFIAPLENGFLVTDKNNNLIRFINNEGVVTTFAGNLKGGLTNGKTSKAQFNKPTGIAVDSLGNIYIADTGNNVIRKIDKDKNVVTYAGGNKNGGYKDGELLKAEFNSPIGLEIKDDVLYVADAGNQRIRMIKDNMVYTYAGNGTEKDDYGIEILGDFIDGGKKTAKFNYPVNIVSDNNGILYVADYGNGAIRKIDKEGNVSTIIKEEIKRPTGMTIKDGNLFVADNMLNRIFKIKVR